MLYILYKYLIMICHCPVGLVWTAISATGEKFYIFVNGRMTVIDKKEFTYIVRIRSYDFYLAIKPRRNNYMLIKQSKNDRAERNR